MLVAKAKSVQFQAPVTIPEYSLCGKWEALLMRQDRPAGGACGRWDTEGSVTCGVAHQVYALDSASGEMLWEFTTGFYVHSSPAVLGGTVFVGSNDNKVRGADPPGRLTAVGVWPCMRLEKL